MVRTLLPVKRPCSCLFFFCALCVIVFLLEVQLFFVNYVHTENLEAPFGNLQEMFKGMSEVEDGGKISPPTDEMVKKKN